MRFSEKNTDIAFIICSFFIDSLISLSHIDIFGNFHQQNREADDREAPNILQNIKEC